MFSLSGEERNHVWANLMTSENRPHTTESRTHRDTAYAYVLWGKSFEETAAIVFASELRNVGLPVRIVGLTSQRALGIRGFALYPDLLLSDLLYQRSRIRCIVLPCSLATSQQIYNDPRIGELFRLAAQDRATFIVSHPEALRLATRYHRNISPKVVTYASTENLIHFARTVAVEIQEPFAAG